MRRLLAALAAVAASGALVTVGPGPTAASADVAPSGGGLRVVTETGGELVGAYSAGDYVLAVRGRQADGRATATLELDGRSVRVSDLASGAALLSTGNVVLTPADRQAVRGAQQAFDRHWAKVRRLPAHSELAGRLIELLTDAPLGVPIASRRIAAPVEVQSGREPAPAALPDRACTTANAAGCQVRDSPDRITYFATCATGKRWFGHDWTSHCFDKAQNYSGPSTAHCFGRCGAGCGSSDRGGTYTYDCGDHDQCNRVHSEQLNGCADEWDEAVNDTVRGDRNCPRKAATAADRRLGGS